MWTYYITFRIADRTIGGLTYNDRRNLLIENATKAKAGFWDGTTSFILAESALDTNKYAAQVCSGLSSEYDMVVVIDPSDGSACYFGAVPAIEVLKSFLPRIVKTN